MRNRLLGLGFARVGSPFFYLKNSKCMDFDKVIKEERVSELIAKRRAIERALEYWDSNEVSYFVKLVVLYLPAKPNAERVEEVVEVRREVISQYLNVECLKYWRYKNRSLSLVKEEYLELWELLKANQVKGTRRAVYGIR